MIEISKFIIVEKIFDKYECEKIFRQWCMLRKKVTKSYLKID